MIAPFAVLKVIKLDVEAYYRQRQQIYDDVATSWHASIIKLREVAVEIGSQ